MHAFVERFQSWLFGSCTGRIVDEISRRAVPNVLQRVEAIATVMSTFEARGYIRARARSVVQQEIAQIVASSRLGERSVPTDRMYAMTLERVVQLTASEIGHRQSQLGRWGIRRAA